MDRDRCGLAPIHATTPIFYFGLDLSPSGDRAIVLGAGGDGLCGVAADVRGSPREHPCRWAPTVDDATRLQLEQRYRLARAEPREDRTFGYALTDRSRDNIRSLVLDPAVEDTHEIDRTAFRVGDAAPRLPYVTRSPGIPVGLEFLSVLGSLAGSQASAWGFLSEPRREQRKKKFTS